MVGRKVFALLVAVLFIYVASPLVIPVTMGAVLATLFVPWLEILERRKISSALGSAIVTLVITLVFVLPSSIMTFVGTREAFDQIQALRSQPRAPLVGDGGWANALIGLPRVHRLLEQITHWLPVTLADLTQTAEDLTRVAAAKIAEIVGEFATHLPGMGVSLTVMIVSIYFFLVDGRKLAQFFRRNSVFSAHQTDQLLTALAGTCRSVLLASLASGAAQAIFELIVCLACGVPNAALMAVLVLLGSFVPVIGSAPVTLGVALHQYLLDHHTASAVLLVSAGLVAVLDNFIRPLFLRGSANLHPLLAFVAAFGGLQTLGFSGIFIGPIIAAVFVVTIQILVLPEEVVGRIERPGL